MKQRVLYFDVVSLLLSAPDRESSLSIQQAFDATNQFSKEFIENISLDKQAINLLNEFSRKANVLLYPLQQRFKREFLVEQGFADSALAPNASYKVRYGDSNEVNHKISHAHAINADWFFVSDGYNKEYIKPQFPGRFIDAGVAGVSSDLIQNLMDKFDVTEK
ncbi:hypothetical protein [Vibrio diazotrophicus]|uniref:hypothetical protein n=1 Tax=Vibrio diazotrophicus TaxID=685 RepID=UPI000C9E46FB|nr:hypothetical protein [Vibrio diazotrophicus]PNH93717.1 hypothetical protein C1O24_18230 [Vibrio diazotrophicus]